MSWDVVETSPKYAIDGRASLTLRMIPRGYERAFKYWAASFPESVAVRQCTYERGEKAYQMRVIFRMSYREIGEKLGVAREQARQLCEKQRRIHVRWASFSSPVARYLRLAAEKGVTEIAALQKHRPRSAKARAWFAVSLEDSGLK